MRTLRIFFAIITVALLMTSCGESTNSLIDKYEAAMQAGDYDRAAEYYDKLSDRKLTDEQAMRISNITTREEVSKIRELYLRTARKAGEIMSEERMDKTVDACNKAIDEGLEEYDKALDEYLGK